MPEHPQSRERLGHLRVLILLLCMAGPALADAQGSSDQPASPAGSFIGDHGHFLYSAPTMHALNREGEAFEVTWHRMMWTMPGLGRGTYPLEVRDPEGRIVAEGELPSGVPRKTLKVPAGEPGVYAIDFERAGYGLTWIETTLDHSVVHAGDWEMKDGELDTFILHGMVPRRWWFYVPEDVDVFEVKHTVLRRQSHRENYGFLVMNPRGQRVAAFYGGRPHGFDGKRRGIPKPIVKQIETDPGTRGRFWSIWVTGGDSHNFSDLQIMLEGVPPWFSPTPEQWFDPATGKAPPPLIYDESNIRLEGGDGSNNFRWAPTPFLGDDDYNGFRGEQTLYLLNPESRELTVGVTTYLVPDREAMKAELEAFGPGDASEPIASAAGRYAHRSNVKLDVPAAGKGVYRIEVGAPRWYPWHEPATPIVIAGKATDSGAFRFELETGIARHWYFKVPEGTGRFRLGVDVAEPEHAILTEVHAPDRMLESLYTRGGAPRDAWIDVPDGLDGHIWFIRTEIGSGTRLISDDPSNPRQMRVDVDLELEGVPGYLAPTWGQWFDPQAPREAD